MAKRRSSHQLARQGAELAIAVPQVMAHRLTRMALAGTTLSARDRKEFHGMGQEKVVAFSQAWMAMGVATTVAMQKSWLAMMTGSRAPMLDAQAILAKGMAPVHRKATANAKRLRKTSLR